MQEIVLYTTEDGKSEIQLRAEQDTVWLSQLEIAELFDTTKQNASLHLKNIFEDGELSTEATVKESLTVQTEGDREVQRSLSLYNLDAILAVGYRVRSPRGVQFRRWASTVLKEYLLNCPSPKGASAYQPRAMPWESNPIHSRVLKERRISLHGGLAFKRIQCGVPSERIRLCKPVPRVSPWAGIRYPVGA